MRIRFTPTARAQFLQAVRHIHRDKPKAAIGFRKKAEKSLKRLIRFPESGRHLPEFPELPYREVVVPPYQFFYRIKKKTVWIIAVWHGSQLPDEPTQQHDS
jgi:plasmid stabilization system protein ParE